MLESTEISPQLMHFSPKILGALQVGHNPLSFRPSNHHKDNEIANTAIGVPTIQSIADPISMKLKQDLLINNLLCC